MEAIKSIFNGVWKYFFGITFQVWAAVMLYLYTTRSSDPPYCGYFSSYDDLKKERIFLLIINIPCVVIVASLFQKIGPKTQNTLSMLSVCFLGTRLFSKSFLHAVHSHDVFTSSICLVHYALVILALFGMAKLMFRGGMIDPIAKPCKDLYRQWPLVILAQCYLMVFIALLYVYQISAELLHEKTSIELETTEIFLDFGFTWAMFFFLNLGFVGFCGPYCPVPRDENEPRGPLSSAFYVMRTQLNLISFLSLLTAIGTEVYSQKIAPQKEIDDIGNRCFLTEIWSMRNYHLIVIIPLQKIAFFLLAMAAINRWNSWEALKNLVILVATKFGKLVTSIYLSMVLPTIYGFIKLYILYIIACLIYPYACETALLSNVTDPLKYSNPFYFFVLSYPILFVMYPVCIVEVASHIRP